MAVETKYLVFKGISKKEEILFRSYINLAKNELPYKVEVFKADQAHSQAPDIIIADESYTPESSEKGLMALPTLVVGDDHNRQEARYVTRPVQWSEFKYALTEMNINVSVDGHNLARILPKDVRFVIVDTDESETQGDEPLEQQYSDKGNYELEIDKASIDSDSFSNGDHIRVVDEVNQFNGADTAENDSSVILVTNEESASPNSVLVLETNTVDAWDIRESELDIKQIVGGQSEGDDATGSGENLRSGTEIADGEEYWLEDNEVIVDNASFLFIKPSRKMVYSKFEPGKWPAILQRKKLIRIPLEKGWRPAEDLHMYSLSSLIWVNTFIGKTRKLARGLDDKTEYLLERWPHFDLLELDNVLLKLCTMLFVRPESVDNLAKKSGYGRSTIRGLMNACHEMGYLKLPDQIDPGKLANVAGGGVLRKINNEVAESEISEESMFNKIKDVFR